jgi:pimeloyl-ACP methyl ester carboxylesterase
VIFPQTPQNLAPQAIVARMADQSVRLETPCGDGRLVWRCWGKGPPILLLHGSHGSWMHWIKNIPHLSKGRSVWVPDIPGFGYSASPSPTPSIVDIAGAIAAGLEALAIDGPLDVVGFSFGGTVAANLATIAPDRVRRIILVDCGGLGTPMASLRMARVSSNMNNTQAHRHNLLALMIHDPAKLDDLALYVQALHVPLARVDVRDMVLPDRLLRALERIDTPVDAIWGEYDQPHPDPNLQISALRTARPKARMCVVPDAGHWSIYETSAAFNAHLDELLQSTV